MTKLNKIIEELITRYYEIGLITTQLIPIKQKDGSSIIQKERTRTAKAFDMRNTTGQLDDNMQEDFNEAERQRIADQLWDITWEILESKPEKKVGLVKTSDTNLKENNTKIRWCIKVLTALQIISPFPRIFYSPLEDKEGINLGVKQVPEEERSFNNL